MYNIYYNSYKYYYNKYKENIRKYKEKILNSSIYYYVLYNIIIIAINTIIINIKKNIKKIFINFVKLNKNENKKIVMQEQENHSFTMQFNPINEIRTAKDIENEIQELRSENFTLKHQISVMRQNPASNKEIENVLMSNREIIKSLELRNQELANELENFRNNFFSKNENLKSLTEENQRLLNYIEVLNTKNEEKSEEVVKIQRFYEEKIQKLEKNTEFLTAETSEIKVLKDEIFKLRTENKDYLKRFKEMGDLRKEVEKNMSQIYELEKECESKDSNIEQIKNEYKKLLEINRNLSTEIEEDRNSKKEISKLRVEFSEKFDKEIQREQKKFESKFKEILLRSESKLKKIDESVKDLENLADEIANNGGNKKIVLPKKIKDKIKQFGFEEPLKISMLTNIFKNLIIYIKEIEDNLYKKESELKDMKAFKTGRKSDGKTMALLEEFHKEFESARQELLECQEFIIEKGVQNKELRKEMNKAQTAFQKMSLKYETSKKNKMELEHVLKKKETEISGLVKKLHIKS